MRTLLELICKRRKTLNGEFPEDYICNTTRTDTVNDRVRVSYSKSVWRLQLSLFVLLNRVRVQIHKIWSKLMLVPLPPQTVYESEVMLNPANYDHVDVRAYLKLETNSRPCWSDGQANIHVAEPCSSSNTEYSIQADANIALASDRVRVRGQAVSSQLWSRRCTDIVEACDKYWAVFEPGVAIENHLSLFFAHWAVIKPARHLCWRTLNNRPCSSRKTEFNDKKWRVKTATIFYSLRQSRHSRVRAIDVAASMMTVFRALH